MVLAYPFRYCNFRLWKPIPASSPWIVLIPPPSQGAQHFRFPQQQKGGHYEYPFERNWRSRIVVKFIRWMKKVHCKQMSNVNLPGDLHLFHAVFRKQPYFLDGLICRLFLHPILEQIAPQCAKWVNLLFDTFIYTISLTKHHGMGPDGLSFNHDLWKHFCRSMLTTLIMVMFSMVFVL